MKKSEFIELWLQALESGKYKQTKGALVRGAGKEKRYCCLGVACVIGEKNGIKSIKSINIEELQLLPNSLAKFLNMQTNGEFKTPIYHENKTYGSLVALNDAGVRFSIIARIIREQIKAKNFAKPSGK